MRQSAIRLPFFALADAPTRNLRRWSGDVATAFLPPGAYTFPSLAWGGMGVVIYLDGFVGLNFLVDLMLLLGVNRLSGHPPGLKRAAAAAAVGGGYAGMCLLPSMGFLASYFWRSVSLTLMSVTAFGLGRSAWSRGLLFVLLSMAMGGFALSLEPVRFAGLLLAGITLAAVCMMGFRGKLGRRLVPVEIVHDGKRVKLLALCDTGNTLRDPVTGESVLVAGPEAAGELLGLNAEQLKNPVSVMKVGMRLIPCSTVSASGLMLAVRCDGVWVDGKPAGRLVAFGPERFPGGEYQALTGGQYG